MISGLVPFEEIAEAIKDETGITNLRPYYDKIKRLMFRAEREIGYGGAIVLKKIIYKNVDKYFSFPPDFIELEGIGIDCCPVWKDKFRPTTDGIRFKTAQNKDVVLLYWGVLCDGYGSPITTRNHQEAVTAYCIWKFYSPKIFLGTGNMNANQNYRQEYIIALGCARGDDAFPTLEEWNEIGLLSYSDRRALIMKPTAAYDYCSDDIKEKCEELTPGEMMVYFWQLDNVVDDIDTVIASLDGPSYLPQFPSTRYLDFEDGKIVNYTNIGRICFVIKETEDLNFTISDSLNNDVTDEFDTNYNAETKELLYVSKNHYSYSSIYFKFKKIRTNA